MKFFGGRVGNFYAVSRPGFWIFMVVVLIPPNNTFGVLDHLGVYFSLSFCLTLEFNASFFLCPLLNWLHSPIMADVVITEMA